MKAAPGSVSKALAWVLALLAVVTVVGCSSTQNNVARRKVTPTIAPTETPTDVVNTPTPDKRVQAAPLRVLLVEHPTSNIIARSIGRYEAVNNVGIRVEVAPYNTTHQKELVDLGAGTSEYDVMMVLDTWFPELIASQNILDLKKQIKALDDNEEYDWLSDFVPNVNLLLGQWQKEQYSIPIMASSQILMYRKDLFDQYRKDFRATVGRDLTVPRTWPEFNEVARYFTRTLNPKSPVDYGLSVAAQPGNSSLCLFQTVLWGVGGREFNKKWKVTVNSREGLKAMELWAEQAKYAPPDAADMYWDDMNSLFAKGQAAMQIQWDAYARQVEDPAVSTVPGKVGYAAVPGEPDAAPVIAGWVLIINKNSKQVPLAWEFIKWVTGPEFGRTINLEGGLVPRMSLLEDKELVKRFPYYPAVEESLAKAQQRTSFTPGSATLPAQAQYERILGGAATAAFTGQKAPQEALDDAGEQLGKMLQQIGLR